VRSDLPALPGAYALEFSLALAHAVRIGRQAAIDFPAGEYIYLGSARGPGGLRARLGRHLGDPVAKATHWHIDYLLQFAQRRAFCYQVIPPGAAQEWPLECAWSQFLSGLPGAAIPRRGFGAGDCRCGCAAHLAVFPGMEGRMLLAEAGLRRGMAQAAGVLPELLVYQIWSDVSRPPE
jgi:Uri superfamily endonuclease